MKVRSKPGQDQGKFRSTSRQGQIKVRSKSRATSGQDQGHIKVKSRSD